MKLINVTDNHPRLVLNQLENTDAQLVEVYSAGSTNIIYTEAPFHNEIVIINKKRAINKQELETFKKFFKRKMKKFTYNKNDIIIEKSGGLIEISIPHKQDI